MGVEIEFLKSIPYFSGMSSDELSSIGRLIFERAVERGEMIVLEGEPAEALFFVVSGVVKTFKTSAEGKEQILSLVRPGESFNDVPIFDGGQSPTSAQAMVPVVLYGIRESDMRTLQQDNPQVSTNITKVLAERTRQLVSLVEDLSFRRVIGRVVKILLEYGGNGASPKPRLTQQEMAAMAGTAREVVARSLKALEGEGLIRLERHRVVITDKKALEEMAEVSY